jgi:SPP1 gp7 family putative phage head morphogenesis protein
VSDVAGFDERARQAEPAVTKALLEWLTAIAAAVSLPQLMRALASGPGASFAGVLQAVNVPSLPELRDPALREARRALRLVVARDPDMLRLTFNILDHRVEQITQQQVARLVREVDTQVQEAIRTVVADAYRMGIHPYDFAPQIKELVGLTERQQMAVLNQTRSLMEQGVRPEIVQRRADEYTARLRRYRAKMIARTETIRALNGARVAGFEQAISDGYVNGDTAKMVWVATDGACPECELLDGEEADVGEGFGEVDYPPLHPDCRCTVDLIPG